MGRRAAWMVVVVWLCSLRSADAAELSAAPAVQKIYGGQLAGTCQWPSAVGLLGDTMQCTGALVHPELVITAGHCLEGGPLHTVVLGEDIHARTGQTSIAECVRHPDYLADYPTYADFMVCRLSEPLTHVPIVPIAMGCEAEELVPGVAVVIAGYGLADDGQPEGRKRVVTVPLESVDGLYAFAGSNGMGSCDGDSGGPSYVRLSDASWRVVGTTTGGPECGDWSQTQLAYPLAGWIEDTTGLDVTPCHGADGTWAPGPDCGAFPATPDLAQGSWAQSCAGGSTTPPGETCGPAFGADDPGDTTRGGSDDGDDGDDGDDVDDVGDGSDVDDAAGSNSDDTAAADEDTDPSSPAGADDPLLQSRRSQGCACATGTPDPTLPAWGLSLLAIALGRRRFSPNRTGTPKRSAVAGMR
jgi:MYXO-CTERM domain-containing protein